MICMDCLYKDLCDDTDLNICWLEADVDFMEIENVKGGRNEK